jgi:integrase
MEKLEARLKAAEQGKDPSAISMDAITLVFDAWRQEYAGIAMGLGQIAVFEPSGELRFATFHQAPPSHDKVIRQAEAYFEHNPQASRAVETPENVTLLLNRLQNAAVDPTGWGDIPGFDAKMMEVAKRDDLTDWGRRVVKGVDIPRWLIGEARGAFARAWLEVEQHNEWARSRSAIILQARDIVSALPSTAPVQSAPIVKYVPRQGDRTFGELVEAFKAEKLSEPAEERRYAHVFTALKQIVGVSRPVRAITRSDVKEALRFLQDIPPNASKRWPGLSLAEAIEIADEEDLERIASKTVSLYLSNLKQLFKWALSEGWLDELPTAGIAVEIEARTRRRAYTTIELRQLFGSLLPLKDAEPERWWIPALGLYTGARLNELCQLQLTDVQLNAGYHILNLSEFGSDGVRRLGFSLKNDGSDRLVPIHKKLIEAGFLDYAEARRRKHELRLFDLHKGPDGGWAHHFSKNFGRHIRRIGLTDRGLTFHSFRHGWRDAAEAAGLAARQIDALGGWAPVGQAARYGTRTVVKVLAPLVDLIDFEDFDLASLATAAATGGAISLDQLEGGGGAVAKSL